MAIERILITELISTRPALVVDVRSPAEYEHAHFPGAVSLPLFSNEERKIIGTAYKQESRQVAVRLGLDFFAPRMKTIIDEAEQLMKGKGLSSTDPVYLYCWRGGMRSGAVAWLLDLYGFKVKVLSGGYKSFRRKALEIFTHDHSFQVLGGYTGSGKTELLAALESKGESVIDLEGIAKHKGSAFGNLERIEQPSQEMFENLLALALERTDRERPGRPIWLEDESQRIGSVNLPNAVWEKMRKSPVYFLEIPFEQRLDHILPEYGAYDKQALSDAIVRISRQLGGLEAKNALAFLAEGNIREAFSILLHYYDKKYHKSLYNRENISELLTPIPCQTVSTTNTEKLLQVPTT